MPFVSAGAYVREFDFSDYVPNLSSSIYGILTQATKGPVNEPTLVTNEGELIQKFGPPLTTDYGLWGGIHYLRRGRQLVVNRVATSSAAKATVTVQDSGALDVFTIEAYSEGTWANGGAMEVIVANGSGTGLYNITVRAAGDNEGTLVDQEQFLDVVLTPSTDERYIESVINDGVRNETRPSDYITVEVVDGSLTPVTSTYTLSGGDDGITGIGDSDYIGVQTGQTATGFKALQNAETLDLNIMGVPGISSPGIINSMIDTCSLRGDCFSIVDSPFGLDVQGVVDWHNGDGSYTHQAFNSSYGGLYWSWAYEDDPYNKTKLWKPPSGLVAGQMAETDYRTAPWFAPAGLTRGRLLAPERLEMSPDLGQRDTLYGNQNAVNPIVDFSKDGITIWGQRTLQRRPTALDRINVRRGLLYMEKIIATAVRYLAFEPNDAITRDRFRDLCTPALEDVKHRRGLYDYRVICDESTNPPIVVDRNELHGNLLLKPTKTAEIIVINFVLLSTGASFSEVPATL